MSLYLREALFGPVLRGSGGGPRRMLEEGVDQENPDDEDKASKGLVGFRDFLFFIVFLQLCIYGYR